MRFVRRDVALKVWWCLLLLATVPVISIAESPYLAYRSWPYIAASFAGGLTLSLLLLQPLMMVDWPLRVVALQKRRWHRRLGIALVIAVLVHVAGLYVASPMDTVDALLLVSPTPFSLYGVVAMWTVFATALFVVLRRRLRLRPTHWAIVHNALALVIVIGAIAHALLIVGTMHPVAKWAMSLAVIAVTGAVLLEKRVFAPRRARRG